MKTRPKFGRSGPVKARSGSEDRRPSPIKLIRRAQPNKANKRGVRDLANCHCILFLARAAPLPPLRRHLPRLPLPGTTSRRRASTCRRRPLAPPRLCLAPCCSLSLPCLSLAPACIRCFFSGSGHRAATPTTTPMSWAHMAVTGRRQDRQDRRSAPSFMPVGPVPVIRTAAQLGPVRPGPPASGPNGGSDRDRTGPDRVHPD